MLRALSPQIALLWLSLYITVTSLLTLHYTGANAAAAALCSRCAPGPAWARCFPGPPIRSRGYPNCPSGYTNQSVAISKIKKITKPTKQKPHTYGRHPNSVELQKEHQRDQNVFLLASCHDGLSCLSSCKSEGCKPDSSNPHAMLPPCSFVDSWIRQSHKFHGLATMTNQCTKFSPCQSVTV